MLLILPQTACISVYVGIQGFGNCSIFYSLIDSFPCQPGNEATFTSTKCNSFIFYTDQNLQQVIGTTVQHSYPKQPSHYTTEKPSPAPRSRNLQHKQLKQTLTQDSMAQLTIREDKKPLYTCMYLRMSVHINAYTMSNNRTSMHVSTYIHTGKVGCDRLSQVLLCCVVFHLHCLTTFLISSNIHVYTNAVS